jgi:hypothetical protein
MLPATPRDYQVKVIGGGTKDVRFEGKPVTIHA